MMLDGQYSCWLQEHPSHYSSLASLSSPSSSPAPSPFSPAAQDTFFSFPPANTSTYTAKEVDPWRQEAVVSSVSQPPSPGYYHYPATEESPLLSQVRKNFTTQRRPLLGLGPSPG